MRGRVLRPSPDAFTPLKGKEFGQVILDGLESALADGYTDKQWQYIAEHLGESVHNGLT
jgi:hypothetical protein